MTQGSGIIYRYPTSILNIVILGLSLTFLIIPSVCADNNWVQVTSTAGWSARGLFGSVVMPDDSIIVMGGHKADNGKPNDVWRSMDNGVTWTLVTVNAGWTARESRSCVVMADGSIIVSGGTLPGGYVQYNDVWRSTDNGVTWTQVN